MKKVFTTLLFLGIFTYGLQAQQTEADFTFTDACLGSPTVLTSTSSVSPLDSIVLYAWDLDGDLSFDDAVGEVVTHTFLGSGYNYNVGLKVTTKFNITKSIYKQVTISFVDVDFTFDNTCHGDVTMFYDLSTTYNDNIQFWLWDFGDGGASVDQNPTYVYPDHGNDTVTLMVMTVNGCQGIKQIGINILPTPDVELTYSQEPVSVTGDVPNFEFYEGQFLTITVKTTGLPETIEWFRDGVTVGFGDEYMAYEKGDYTVVVTDENDCYSEKYFTVLTIFINDVEPDDIFTPNGDGINEYWIIKPDILPDESYEVIIYNRYGDQVYSAENYRNDWGGTYEGNPLPEGAYYYIIINNRNKDQVFKGPVNILR